MPPRIPLFPAAIVAIAVFLLAVGGVWAQDGTPAQEAPSESDKPAESARTKGADRRAPAGPEALVAKIWWNQPKKVQELGLTDAQRQKMDAVLRAYLEDRPAAQQRQRQAFAAISDALAAGDRDAALRQGEAAARAAGDPVLQQVEMMIDVAVIMTPEQRKTFTETYPRMFSRPWIRTGSGRLLEGNRGGGR